MEFERGKAYVVDRGDPKPRYGQGLTAGLGVVLKHFRDAFGKKLDQPSETSGVFTVQYPEERLKLAEAYRNFPILLYEEESGQELCTSCFQCERICPPQVIHMTQAKDPATGKPVPAVAEFLLEYDACMSCGLCAEVCPFDAIKMDHEFELSTDVHGGLTINKAGLNRPIAYYAQLAPTFWAEVKDSALKKLQGNIKRRPGTIGNAIQEAEIRDQGSEGGDQEAGPMLVAAIADDRPQAIEAVPAVLTTIDDQPATADARSPAEAKAAKLAAIRARNTANQAAAATADQPATIETTPIELAPAEAKAAKLAAIRAANVAKQAAITDEQPPIAESPAELAPADAKAAKLAAIRAANAAKRAADQSPDE